MAGPSVLAILVAHASRTRVTEALRSLGAQTYDSIEIVVAAIGDLSVPEDVSPSVIPVPEGAGFGDAVMEVLARVRPEGFAYVLLLHDDVSLEPDAIERMVTTAGSDPAIAAVGAKLVEWFEPDVLQEVGAAIDRFAIRRSALDASEVDAGQRDETSDVLFCSDACLLVRRDALIEVGGLDPKAWPFYEDVDLCWRLRARGARVVVDPNARVRHAADLSRGRRLFESMALREHAEHGRLRFMLKHYSPLGLAVLLPQVAVATLGRIVVALARRELWRLRVIFGAWARLFRELPGIVAERRRAPEARVEDRELLALAARGAVGDVRGERAEWASRFLSYVGRTGERSFAAARQPASWMTLIAVVAVVALLRNALFGETFALGELRALPTFADAVTGHFERVRRDGLDPFGPAGPGLIVLGIVRSIATRAALAEKIVLVAPLFFAAIGGARIARTLAFTDSVRRWVAVTAAVNPVTLSLLRDGSIGVLVMWAASLWLVGQLIAPVAAEAGLQGRIRFVARWAFVWALAVSLHPPAFVWLLVLSAVVTFVRRRHDPARTRDRVRIIVAGAVGSFVLLLPWSAEWLTIRSPLFGRPGWLVHSLDEGLIRASLGGGWPVLALLTIALLAAIVIRLDRMTFALGTLIAFCLLAGAGGVFGRETMLAASGVCAFLVLALVGRYIVEGIREHQLGRRQAAAIVGVLAVGAVWLGGVVTLVPSGARVRSIPVIAGVQEAQTARVLWLAETTSGVRAWSTLGFTDELSAFPLPQGPEERLVTKAIEAARTGRTHRLGGILALTDVSHIVSLDESSRRGLGSQADLAPQEEQGAATVFRNDAWRGPAIILTSPPTQPLTPAGLADAVRDPRRAAAIGWPYGSIRVRTETEEDAASAVLYIASGRQGGLRIEGAKGRLAAAGAYVPLSDVLGTVNVEPPGRWWRWMLPVEALLVVALLAAWIAAAYIGAPIPANQVLEPDLDPLSARRFVLAGIPLLFALGVAFGWTGVTWGVGTPFLSSAWYCPPIGREYDQSIAIANPNRGRVEYLVRSDLGAPPVTASRITGRSRHTLDISSGQGAVVESYGRRLVVATQVNRLGSRDASLCASDTRRINIFPEGGRAATRAVPRLFERYILYNPFPDLARASIRFVSPDEPIAPPALRDVRVKPGSYVIVDPEDQFEPMLDLSTTVRVWQGRAIVARRLRTVDQVSWSLPVEETVGGIIPRATTEDAVTSLIAVNLSEDPAHVTVFGAGRTGSLPEETFDVSAVGRTDFDVTTLAPRTRDLVIGVESDLPAAIESLVATDDRVAVSLLSPLQPQRRWVLPLAEQRELVLVNPTTARIRVSITRLGPGDPFRDVTIDANRVQRIRLRGEAPFGLLVESQGGAVTAAVVGARGTTPGVPLLSAVDRAVLPARSVT